MARPTLTTSSTRTTQPGYDTPKSKSTETVELLARSTRSISTFGEEFLQIVDVRFDGSAPQPRATISANDNVAERMRQLEPHQNNSARILDVTVHSDFKIEGLRDERGPKTTEAARGGLIQYLHETYPPRFISRQIFKWLNDPLLVNDIGSISSQWSQSFGDRDTHFARLVNRTSLQQHPLDYELRPRNSYLTCAKDANDRLLVIIVHDVWSRQKFRLHKKGEEDSFTNPRILPRLLDTRKSWTSFSDGSLETFAKLLVLDFFQASIYLQPVDYYERLIYPTVPVNEGLKLLSAKNPHLQVPLGLFEPRLSAKSREAFTEIEDAEGILRSVNSLVDSIKYVVESLKQDATTGAQQTTNIDYEKRTQDLKALYSERRENTDRALNALNRQLDYLTKRHAINESKSIRILTILAALYLPLSLSSSILGMSTPFRAVAHDQTKADIDGKPEEWLIGTNLLFDFFGVFVVLSTITILLVHLIRLTIWLRHSGLEKISRRMHIFPKHLSGPFTILNYGKGWRFDGRGSTFFQITRLAARWFIGIGFGILLLVIFLVGMLRSDQPTWKYAQWGFATYLTISSVLLLIYVVSYWILYHRSFGGPWSAFIGA